MHEINIKHKPNQRGLSEFNNILRNPIMSIIWSRNKTRMSYFTFNTYLRIKLVQNLIIS